MTITEYRKAWREHAFHDGWVKCPTVKEKCGCGVRITRNIGVGVTCAKCGHKVKSYQSFLY